MWILFSLLTALSLSTSDALTKRVLATRDEYFVAWARLIFALPFLTGLLLFIEIPELDGTFWLAIAAGLPLEITALVLYTKALKLSPLGLTAPFLALSPIFLIVTSYLIVGEQVSLSGMAGIALVVTGSYTLNIHRIKESVLAPVKAIFSEKGSVLMIIVAFIYSITASLGKVAIEHSSPEFCGSVYFILMTVLYTPFAMKLNRDGLKIRKDEILTLALVGGTFALMIIFHMIAMSLTNVAYMISLKRTSLLFSILFGFLFFKEKNIAGKALGGVIMLCGFVLIVLWG